MIPMMVNMKIKLMVRGDYENSDSANDESEESDLDDIIFDHDESSSMTVVTKIVIVLMMIKRNIVLGQKLSHDDCDVYDTQGWTSCVSACHKERKSVQPCHPDCGGQKSSIS